MARTKKNEESIQLNNQEVTNTLEEVKVEDKKVKEKKEKTPRTKKSTTKDKTKNEESIVIEEKKDDYVDLENERNRKRIDIFVNRSVERFNPTKDEGLNSDEVNTRRKQGYFNVSNIKTTKSGWEIIRGNVFTFFNMLYFVITILLILAKTKITNYVYVLIVVFNLAMSIYQEFKAKKMIEKLNLVQATKATVIRDGKKEEIDNKDVVLDDIVAFKIGNQIYCDCIVIDGTAEVNESMITGEPDAILKRPGDILYSGSYITSGTLYAKVENVGKDNYIEKLALEAKKQKGNKSELLRSLNLIIRVIGFVIVPLFIIEFIRGYFGGFNIVGNFVWNYDKFCETVTSVAGSIVGMVPAGLFLLTTVSLSQGVFKLGSEYNTSVQDLYCIEMLARVDTLCLDKTGTITDGTMRVVDCVEVKNPTNYSIRDIVGSMMNVFEETNATSEAMIRFFSKNNVLTPTQILPFSSKRKFSAVTFGDVGTFYLGAPEFILIDNYKLVKEKVETYAEQGCRVLALGYTVTGIKKEGIASNVKPVCLIVIQDHIREEAYDTLQFFKNNGVDVKVISGDNPITVSEIAHRAGISGYNRFISLEGLSEEEVKEIAFDYTIFGRVTPNQKKALVEALKAKKRTVAMTGDGVNDILAMKEADCSIAMASGSEATRNISNIVLMDSNFASMPKVVAEGRRVINNIQRTSTLYLTKTLLILFISIFYLVNNLNYPFTTSQMTLIEMVIIGLPSVIISLQANKERVQGKFITNVLRASFPGALTVLILHMLIYFFGISSINPTELAQLNYTTSLDTYTSVVLILTIGVTVVVLARMCKPFNWVRGLVFAFAFIVSAACIIASPYVSFINGFLNLSKLSISTILLILICLLLINPILDLSERFLKYLGKIKISE